MMSLFSGAQPFEIEVDKATSGRNVKEDWSKILEICDMIGDSSQKAKECLRVIVKRLNEKDPHVVILAITLLDACSSNCGKVFHLEIASREFETQFLKLINLHRAQPKIYEKLKLLLKKWAEGDFKTDPQLNIIPCLYEKLKSQGHDFSSLPDSDRPRSSYTLSKDPNVVTSAQEEEEIARAIELSLKDSTKQSTMSHGSPSSKKTTNLYPSVNSALTGTSNSEGRKVKALYDFEAVEDNELTFTAGEIIHILDDSDPNWWKGSNQRGEGLFPSNFVTADLTVEPEQFTKLESNSKKSVQFSEEVEIKTVKKEPEVVEVEIDEHKMDRLLHLLHEADPQSDSSDTKEMIDLEEQVTAMGPLIDTALEKVDKQHAQLTQLSSDLVEAMNLYHMLMREPAISSYNMPKMPPQQMVYPHPQGLHMQPGHPQGVHPSGHPQGHPQGHSQGVPPQGAPAHMFNGASPGMQSQMMAGPQTRFNANMPPGGEMINTPQGPTSLPSMTLPPHYQIPPGLRQVPPDVRQDTSQASQNNIPFFHPYTQGFPGQPGSVTTIPYIPPVPSVQQMGPPQQQFSAPSGQRMM